MAERIPLEARASQHMQSTTWPNQIGSSKPREWYANRVEIVRTEHDATLRFRRKETRSTAQAATTIVAEVTVPAGVLDDLVRELTKEPELEA